MLSSLRANRASPQCGVGDPQFAFGCRSADADPHLEDEAKAYLEWLHPVSRQLARRIWLWGSMAAMKVIATFVFFNYKQQQILNSTRRINRSKG
jgi:hypothetical protein